MKEKGSEERKDGRRTLRLKYAKEDEMEGKMERKG